MGGENSTDALIKTGAHVVGGIAVGLAVGALGITGIGAIAAIAVGSLVVNGTIDKLYENSKKKVGKAIKWGQWNSHTKSSG